MDQRAMGRALMMRLLEPGPRDDYIAAVELVQRASIQPPDSRRLRRAHLADDLRSRRAHLHR
jgi:hypothetical protein